MGPGRGFAIPPPHGMVLCSGSSCSGPAGWLAGRNYYVRKLALSKKRMESHFKNSSQPQHSSAVAMQ